MNVVSIYARLYFDCLRRALNSIGKSPWTLLLPVGLLFALNFAASLAAPFGIGAGFVLGAVLAALGSCYLYFLGEITGNAKVKVVEFGKSVGAYFWSVANVLFVYWIASYVLRLVLQGTPQARAANVALLVGALVLLNAVPEVIYQRQTFGGLATMQRAIHFLQSNWLEWGVPNALLLAALYFFAQQALLFVDGFGALVVVNILVGAPFHVVMVFRGYLFNQLDGSSHRQRMFRYRTAA
jgi:hypothetical protein